MRKMISQPHDPTYATSKAGDVFPSDLKIIFQAFSDSLFYLDQEGVIVDYLSSDSQNASATSKAFLGKKLIDTLPKNIANLFARMIAKTASTGEVTALEYELGAGRVARWFVAKCVLQTNSRMTVVIRDITEQKKAEAVASRQLALMTALNESAQRLSKELDSAVLGEDITRSCVEQFGVDQAWLGYLRGNQIIQPLAYWPMDHKLSKVGASIELNPDELRSFLQKKTHLIIHPETPDSGIQPVKALFPFISHDRVIGILGLLSEDHDFFTSETIDFFRAYSLIAASALENARLFADSNYQLIQIQTLRSIDQAILSDIDLHTTTKVILKESAKHIHADAVALLALDQKTKLLNFVSGYGFRFDTFQHTHLPLGEGFAGQVVLKKQAIDIRNLREYPQAFSRATNFEREGFVTYLGTPLIARGEIKGVLEIFQRRPYEPSAEWFNILETLSNQIAIAIDNALLVEGLKTSNAELNAAYNATIEGLSRALELRDRETQGHTLRVTAMALQLARRIGGFSESELIHIHRGALLHDIGKMGIPDSILLKPGELTFEERKIMQQHPVYANDILFQIEHLKPALDIPRYHHEKWDGCGYPGKLKGEQIPMAARIFSIVDVFDALTSDRPYRKAWPRKQALEYIRSQSGIHFEPAIVEAFMEMMDEEPLPGSSTDANKPRRTRKSFDKNNNLSAAFFNLSIEPYSPSGRLFSDTKPINYSQRG
jgi:HD-GYP domain-containing protein (c-di-GMP phosphodiesterase class II)